MLLNSEVVNNDLSYKYAERRQLPEIDALLSHIKSEFEAAQDQFRDLLGSFFEIDESVPVNKSARMARMLLLYEEDIAVEALARFDFNPLKEICQITPPASLARKNILKALMFQRLSFEQLKQICPLIPADATFGQQPIRVSFEKISVEQFKELCDLTGNRVLREQVSARVISTGKVSLSEVLHTSPEAPIAQGLPEVIIHQMLNDNKKLTYEDYSFVLGETSLHTQQGQAAAIGMLGKSENYSQAGLTYNLVHRNPVLKQEALQRMLHYASTFEHYYDIFQRSPKASKISIDALNAILLLDNVPFEFLYNLYRDLYKACQIERIRDSDYKVEQTDQSMYEVQSILPLLLQKLIETAATFEHIELTLLLLPPEHPNRNRLSVLLPERADNSEDWSRLYHKYPPQSPEREKAVVFFLNSMQENPDLAKTYYNLFPQDFVIKNAAEDLLLQQAVTLSGRVLLYNSAFSGSSLRRRLKALIFDLNKGLNSAELAQVYALSSPDSQLQNMTRDIILDIGSKQGSAWIISIIETLQHEHSVNKTRDRGLQKILYDLLLLNTDVGKRLHLDTPSFEQKMAACLSGNSVYQFAAFSWEELKRSKDILSSINPVRFKEVLAIMLTQSATYESSMEIFDDIKNAGDPALLASFIQKIVSQCSTYAQVSLVYRSFHRHQAVLVVDDPLLQCMMARAYEYEEIWSLYHIVKKLPDKSYLREVLPKLIPFLSHLLFDDCIDLYRSYQPLFVDLPDDRNVRCIMEQMVASAKTLEQYHLLTLLDSRGSYLYSRGRSGMDTCQKTTDDWLKLYKRSESHAAEQALIKRHLLSSVPDFATAVWLYDMTLFDASHYGLLERDSEALMFQKASDMNLADLIVTSKQRCSENRNCLPLHRIIMQKIHSEYGLPADRDKLVSIYKTTMGDPQLNFQLASYLIHRFSNPQDLVYMLLHAPIQSALFQQACAALRPIRFTLGPRYVELTYPAVS